MPTNYSKFWSEQLWQFLKKWTLNKKVNKRQWWQNDNSAPFFQGAKNVKAKRSCKSILTYKSLHPSLALKVPSYTTTEHNHRVKAININHMLLRTGVFDFFVGWGGGSGFRCAWGDRDYTCSCTVNTKAQYQCQTIQNNPVKISSVPELSIYHIHFLSNKQCNKIVFYITL